MWFALTAVTAAMTALAWRDRLAAAEFGLGGFPFNIAPRDYYALLAPAQTSTLLLACILWVFLSAGIVDRLARDTRASGTRFFGACGACFMPLLRLAVVTFLAYGAVLSYLAPALARIANNSGNIVELALYGVLAATLFAVSLVLDYARVRLVVEDRRSAVGAIAASLRLLRQHRGRAAGIQAAFWLLLVVWIAARNIAMRNALIADAGASVDTIALIFGAGELLLKLSLIGAQVSLYQHALASAGWVARQDPAWPDAASGDPAAI